MASPAPIAPNGSYNPYGQQAPPPQPVESDDSGLQVRPMGLKVHYTFDKDAKVNCLARSTQTLQVQTIPMDESNSIGVVDLRACLHAVTECSPELAASQDEDYTIYAFDYSEPDTPLVGQGRLSWALDSMRGNPAAQPPKMVTGRVTKNLLAVFGGGNRETLEVKLKLSAAAKPQQQREHVAPMEMQPLRPMETALTPTGAAEWNSFIQANPQIGAAPSRPASRPISRVASPALSQGPSGPVLQPRRDSFGPNSQGPISQEIQRVAPVPIDPTKVPLQPAARSRSKKRPTGRPRGRPRKKPAEGNTSGYEDGTEGEENGPAQKRAKTVKVDKAAPNPFSTGPESLRVAASTSGSLRNFRPIGPSTEGAVAGSHLQEVPRAPTPVPSGPLGMPPRGSQGANQLRRESSMRQEMSTNSASQDISQTRPAMSPNDDGRSPESMAPTPVYSEDSPQDIGSSPPVARTTPFIRSSPPPSSPVLPPMPDAPSFSSNFMNAEMDDLFDEQQVLQLPKDNTAQSRPVQKVIEVRDSTGIPTQVFQIKEGPNGGDLVHIQNYNTHQFHSTRPPITEGPSLPPLKEGPPPQALAPKPTRPPRRLKPSPALAPTPPPTTDTIEKVASPAPISESRSSVETTEAVHQEQQQPNAQAPTPDSRLTPRDTPQEFPAEANVEAPPAQQAPANPPAAKPKARRPLNRSHSAGPLALPTIPASEPAGPSSLSQSIDIELPLASLEGPGALRRSNSTGPITLPVPASDPVGPPAPTLHLPIAPFSEAPCPPSDAIPPMPSSPPTRSNKNRVKKATIKQRLEEAVARGEMPPFCTNCGAIHTPTWRKIWIQDHEGVPEYVEYSDKPGRVTAIDIMRRDEDNKPLAYRLIKKSLGSNEDRSAWQEQLLCNPCGIWLVKYRNHRPPHIWSNSFGPLGADRKRGPSTNNSKPKKRSKSEAQSAAPTSEACFPTDPAGPVEPSSPKLSDMALVPMAPAHMLDGATEAPSGSGKDQASNNETQSDPGSTHSRGSGTARSPIDLDLDDQLGSTKRLLFPSPRKDGSPKVLEELNVNIVQTTECRQNKDVFAEKENMLTVDSGNAEIEHDELEALFRSPAPATARPSTPPPKAKGTSQATPFKTPTRQTPSHRPITRSVSRSLRSIRDMMSPSQQTLLQRTPTKTPRGVPGSASLRRSPRNHQNNLESVFDTPLSRTISQMLSEPSFDLGNGELDLNSLPTLDGSHGSLLDFGNILSTDGIVPSSPPKDGLLSFEYDGAADVWAQWSFDQKMHTDDMDDMGN